MGLIPIAINKIHDCALCLVLQILDHLIRNCFDAHAASWKHTQNLNEDQQEYSGKGLRSLDAYHNFTNIYS